MDNRCDENQVEFGEKCAVVGVVGGQASFTCYACLRALCHRGQDSTGMVVGRSYDPLLREHKGLGLASQVFFPDVLASLVGDLASGHNRYATAGPPDLANAQPHLIYPVGLAYAGNGDIPPIHFSSLVAGLKAQGIRLSSDNDGELIARFLARTMEEQCCSLEQAVPRMMEEVIGSYASVALHGGQLYAWRDPLGIRPLVLGKTADGWVVASETCAFGLVSAKFQRDVYPGELLVFRGKEEPRIIPIKTGLIPKQCVFELIYFSRPDSICFGIPVSSFRKHLGSLLAEDVPIGVDCVAPVPDSSNYSALAFAEATNFRVPYVMALLRDHYVGRTFILPVQIMRDETVRLKLSPVVTETKGRSIVLVDDSIVRGTTARQIVRMLRTDGEAREIHLRIASPPTRFPCHYGIATPTTAHLLASRMSIEEMRRHLEVDSLQFISVDQLNSALQRFGQDPNHFCKACFDGQYPTTI